MNDVFKQFNTRAEEIKPTRHQRALKMAVLKNFQAENAKRRDTKWGLFFNFFSMSFTKTLVVGLGVLVVAVVGVASWNPLMQGLGFANPKTTQVSAQELLKLTREQYNALTPDERKRLAESVQGKLEQIWQEAEQAKDLRFLQGEELIKISISDTSRAFGHSASTTEQAEKAMKEFPSRTKDSAFRYTDPQGKITFINLSTYETLPAGLLLSSKTNIAVIKINATAPIVSFDERMKEELTPEKMKQLEEQAKVLTRQLTVEQKQAMRQMMEKKLQKYYPDVFEKWSKAANQEIVIFNLFDNESLQKNMARSRIFMEENKYETLRNNTEAVIMDIDSDKTFNFTAQYAINVYFTDEQGKQYFVMDVFDSENPEKLENQLFIQRQK